jgi:quercetin dioxygenase-like cupin family protein
VVTDRQVLKILGRSNVLSARSACQGPTHKENSMHAKRPVQMKLQAHPAWVRLAVALPILILGTAGVALATSGSGITTTNISVGDFAEIDENVRVDGYKLSIKAKGASDVYVVSNVFAPGGQSGWHTHPGPSLITVKSGTITAYSGDDPSCTPEVYAAGAGFVDPGDGHVHILRNEGDVPAETIAVQLLPDGAPRRIDSPAPGNCPF